MRYFLLLLVACCGYAEDEVALGLGPTGLSYIPSAATITTRRLGVDPELGLGAQPTTFAQVMTAANFTTLNTLPLTTVRATSAWDPRTEAIVGANVLRTRTETIGGVSYTSHLIEALRTNILAAGTSGRFDQWTAANGLTVTADTTAAPGGEVIAQTLTDPGASLSSARQTFTVADDSIAHTFTIDVLKTSGGTAPTFGVTLALTGGTPVTTNARINTDTGTQQYGSNASTTVYSADATYWRVVVMVTNNTTANTTLTLDVYPAASAYGASVDSAAATGTAICTMADLIKAGSTSGGTGITYQSFISNRNLLLQTETLNTTWTKTRCSITSDSTANPLDSSVTADSIVEDATASSTHFIVQSSSKTASAKQYTFSTYLKQSGRTWAFVQCSDNPSPTAGNGIGSYYDVANGVKGTTVAVGAGWTLDANHITAVGSWYRIDITVTTNAGTTIQSKVCAATADNGISFTGTSSTALICYGNQLVYGAKPQNYWAVGNTIGVRSADAVSIDLTGLSGGGLSTTAGTLIDVARPYGWNNFTLGVTLQSFTQHSAAGHVALGVTSATVSSSTRNDGGGLHTALSGNTWTNGVTSTIAVTWDASAVRGYHAGAAGTIAVPASLPYVACTSLPLGSNDSAGTQNSYSYNLFLYSAAVLSPSDIATFHANVTP